MNKLDEKYLFSIIERSGVKFPKVAMENPLENSMWENMLDGALKALEFVALASLDWKLTAIVKLFQSWWNDKKEEKKKKELEKYTPGSYDWGGTYY